MNTPQISSTALGVASSISASQSADQATGLQSTGVPTMATQAPSYMLSQLSFSFPP